MTDNYSVYWTLGDVGYEHGMVNHSIEFVNAYDRNVHTETVEGGFKDLKADLNRSNGIRTKFMQMHLDEFDFRCMYLNKNRKNAFYIVAKLLGRYGHAALQWVLSMSDHHY